MQQVALYIERHVEEPLTLASLSPLAGRSSTLLQKTFKAVFGVSPKAFQDGLRTRRFKSLLRAGEDVTDAIYAVGYGSPSRVYGDQLRNIGMTPGAYRAGGAGEQISYACRVTALGPLMMGATDRGVCFAMFGNSESDLFSALAGEFPNATILSSKSEHSDQLTGWIHALDEHLSCAGPHPNLPLDLQGTAFQLMVWRFLLTVPEGSVVSYAEVAAGIGREKAHRAAATACGANRIAVLIPCHRVLRSNGDIGGYRWGIDRKRSLLAAERRRLKSHPL